MPGKATGYATDPSYQPDDLSTSTQELKDKAASTASQVKDKAIELGQSAADTIDQKRVPAANAMASAASTLHQTADNLPGVQAVSRLTHQTADTLQSTADYVRGHDTKAMMNDVESFVMDHPGQSLAVAVALGFLVGRAFRRD